MPVATKAITADLLLIIKYFGINVSVPLLKYINAVDQQLSIGHGTICQTLRIKNAQQHYSNERPLNGV